MKYTVRFLVAACLLAGLSACYTPRDVRPAAVAAAKATSERDLPVLAREMNRSSRARLAAQFQAYLEKHRGVFGVAFAPVPANGPALYVCRVRGGYVTRELTPPSYDYAASEWYRKPLARGAACWSAPYFDADGGEVWMETYSVPVAGGIVTNDVPVFGPRG